MAIRQRKKRDWFDRGAAAYSSVRTEQHGEPIYPCPICLTPFTVDAIADGRLSSEHVPPESVGGHELVLTCKRCNNSAGTKVDADAAVKELVLPAMAGTRQHRERVKAAIAFGLRVLRTPVQAPKAKAYCERLVGTIRREGLDYVIPLSEKHLRTIMSEWIAHYKSGTSSWDLGARHSGFRQQAAAAPKRPSA